MKISIWAMAIAIGVQLVAYSAVPLRSARAQEAAKCQPENRAKDYPSLVSKTIKIGADPETQPYVYRDPKDFNKVIGIDADLARAVLECVGLRYSFVLGGWSGLLPAAMAGQIDVMWDDLYYTPVRAKKLDYVIYMQAADAGLVEAGNPKHISSLGDVCGLTGASLLGTVEEEMLRSQDKKCQASGKSGIRILTAANNAALTRLLEHGRTDIILNDIGLNSWLAAHNPDKYKLAFKVVTGYNLGAGVAKDDGQLARAIESGLRIVQANGTQKAIMQRYNVDPSLETPAKLLTK